MQALLRTDLDTIATRDATQAVNTPLFIHLVYIQRLRGATFVADSAEDAFRNLHIETTS
jgi:hypothetical protein